MNLDEKEKILPLFKSITQSANDAIISIDRKGIILFWNSTASKIFGYNQKEAVGQTIEIIIPDNEYWPLPWYLRAYSNTAWWDHVEYDQPAAPLIIVAAFVEKELIKKLYEQPPPGQRHLYISLFNRTKELRPGLELRTYVRKDLWDLLPEDLKSGD